jgi:hypothetical protein
MEWEMLGKHNANGESWTGETYIHTTHIYIEIRD